MSKSFEVRYGSQYSRVLADFYRLDHPNRDLVFCYEVRGEAEEVARFRDWNSVIEIQK